MLRFSKLGKYASNFGKNNIHTLSTLNRKTTFMSTHYIGPLAVYLKRIQATLDMLPEDEKHWFCGGTRSTAVAIDILRKNEVIALPTDTIYGFAALAQSDEAIEKLYAIKGREKTKPLAIAIAGVSDIKIWANIDLVPYCLLTSLLPGPVTVVLKRTDRLNPRLNPGHESVGIRVPQMKFIRHLCNLVGPLALTSANISNEPSSLHPDEFAPLWPKLGAIFYDVQNAKKMQESQRVGSTVVDLTVPGEYEILRRGMKFHRVIEILNQYSVRRARKNDDEEGRSECKA